jgi:hypothetical protein
MARRSCSGRTLGTGLRRQVADLECRRGRGVGSRAAEFEAPIDVRLDKIARHLGMEDLG